MNDKHIAAKAKQDPDWPCKIVAGFLWKGTANDYWMTFHSQRALDAFQAKAVAYLELDEVFYHKARYIQGVDSPKVIDYNDGWHTQKDIDEVAAILGYCTAKPYESPEYAAKNARREAARREEAAAWARYHANNPKTL